MAAQLGYLPERITAGQSIWIAAANTAESGVDIIVDDYTPAAGYTLAYQFAAPTPVSIAAVANGGNTGWTLDVTAAQTLAFGSGRIVYVGIATHTATSRTFAVDSGAVMVDASPMRVSSWAAVVTAIDASIAVYAANPHGSVNIEGFSASYRSMDDLIKLREYAVYMRQQDTANRPPRIIRARFT